MEKRSYIVPTTEVIDAGCRVSIMQGTTEQDDWADTNRSRFIQPEVEESFDGHSSSLWDE